MRWAVIVALGLWAWLLLLAWALDSTAHAGFDSPTQHAPISKHAASAAIPGRHCSKVGNPFECSQGGSAPDKHWGEPTHDRSCSWLRVMYEYHHATTGKPRSLTGLFGCRLWRADAAYHDALRRVGVPEFTGEAIETVQSLYLAITQPEGATP